MRHSRAASATNYPTATEIGQGQHGLGEQADWTKRSAGG